MSVEEEKNVTNGGHQDNQIILPSSNSTSKENGNAEPLQILGQLKTIEQINEQRRIFLNSTINEEEKDNESEKAPEEKVQSEPKPEPEPETESEPEQKKPPAPPTNLTLNVKYATLPSPVVATNLRSPMSPPPPKPPMLSRTRSTGSGDGRSPPLINGNNGITASASASPTLLRQSIIEATPTQEEKESLSASSTISVRHYESLIEELRCPGCAGAMKAPVLLCKSGHSVCEQCTRILLMCPLCKESFTNSRSLTVEALCAKAHFRCSNAPGGCQVRMPVALLPWHEQQCIYKPMKCFMGRVWGDCKWHGREVQWKEHLEQQHSDKLFCSPTTELVWNMSVRRKPLTGYYVFEAYDEMFNFYEIYDKTRILFTMTCTSNRRESKYNYAYEVTLLQPDNEALSLTQKFPVHSEYDRDILMEGTCVSIGLNELSRFIDAEKVLHYRVGVLAVKSPRRTVIKPVRQSQSMPTAMEYQQMQNAGVNGKSIPSNMIITRTFKEAVAEVQAATADPATPDSTDDGGSIELERKWGTPQLHFNRKYLRNTWAEGQQQEDELRPLASDISTNGRGGQENGEDKLSVCSNTTSYTKKVADTLRKSFRAIKTDIIELRPLHKKNTKAVTTTTGKRTSTGAATGSSDK